MKIRCLHGFYSFEETNPAQISDFMRFTGLKIVPHGTIFTFDDLTSAPEYSIKGKALQIGKTPLPAIADFAGEPWEVLEANEMVYDFTLGILRPITSITQIVDIDDGGNRFLANGIILAGSLTAEGNRVKDYAAHFSRSTQRFLYTEVSYA